MYIWFMYRCERDLGERRAKWEVLKSENPQKKREIFIFLNFKIRIFFNRNLIEVDKFFQILRNKNFTFFRE